MQNQCRPRLPLLGRSLELYGIARAIPTRWTTTYAEQGLRAPAATEQTPLMTSPSSHAIEAHRTARPSEQGTYIPQSYPIFVLPGNMAKYLHSALKKRC